MTQRPPGTMRMMALTVQLSAEEIKCQKCYPCLRRGAGEKVAGAHSNASVSSAEGTTTPFTVRVVIATCLQRNIPMIEKKSYTSEWESFPVKDVVIVWEERADSQLGREGRLFPSDSLNVPQRGVENR
ncbi:hypothetical protein HYFRA_00011621 [Hymenoscyphus fraxineus]|uniref:Uncharacterized protein n=1 Tax=Hymenoscyphus fraxineus TaxID=746836 RepID=A0A9N9L121_9HELO|nr:hypothetical protein HYFRA_00011621 [Hymenoscyphus fraxineus]